MNRPFLLAGTVALVAASVASAQWSVASPATSPGARSGPAMTYDTLRGETLLFGGGSVFSFLNDTWAYDGGTWRLHQPATSPGGRIEAKMVYDLIRGVTVLYGGNAGGGPFGGPSVDETWEWDGTTWSQATTTTTPGGLANHGMAYDLLRGRVVVYGGLADSSFPIAAGDTWECDGNDWTLVTTTATPGPRQDVAMCYHAGLQAVVLFGGVDPQVGGFGDTWTYDGTSWTRLTIAGSQPSPRTRSQMVYDLRRNVCVMYGGMDATNGQLINETWEFDGTSWTQVASPVNPTDRQGFGLAMDRARSVAVMFGGLDARFTERDDTLEFGATFRPFGQGCAGLSGVPVHGASTMPEIGGTFTATVDHVDPSVATAFLLFAFSKTSVGGTPLPIDLTPIGMTGCSAYTSGDLAFGFPVVTGSGSWSTSVPTSSSYYGAPFWTQVVIPEAGANPIGLISTNGGEAVIGR